MRRSRAQRGLVVAAAAGILAGGAGLLPGPAHAQTSAAASPPTVLVVLVDWAAGNGTPAASPDGTTPEQATGQLGGTDAAWYQAVSYNQFGGFAAAAVNWSTISAPPFDTDPGTQLPTCSNGFRSTIQNEADAAAQRAGFDPAAFPVLMYYFPRVPQCSWGGWTFGRTIWLNGQLDTGTTVHELSHELGLGHAHLLRCVDAANHPVVLSGSCTTDEYGDSYSVMGCCAPVSFTAIQKAQLGWMSSRIADVPSWGGTYTLQPIEVTVQTQPQALRIPDSAGTIWLEYRRPIGVDARWADPSRYQVLVHVQRTEDGNPYGSFLLDMTPGTATVADAGLPVGGLWTTPSSRMAILVTAADDNGAQIRVMPDTATVPSVVGDSLSQASATLQASGFVLGPVGYALDYLCENINRVMNQNPGAGTQLAPGSAVNVTIGRKPPAPFQCP